jgi:hypothetical protein
VTVTDVFDPTIVNVTAPSIRAGHGGGEGTVQWLSVGYTLAFAVPLSAAGCRVRFVFLAATFCSPRVVCGQSDA